MLFKYFLIEFVYSNSLELVFGFEVFQNGIVPLFETLNPPDHPRKYLIYTLSNAFELRIYKLLVRPHAILNLS